MSRATSARLRYFSRIETVEQAEQAIREVAYALYVVAGLFLLVGVFAPVRLRSWGFDLLFTVGMGLILHMTKSRSVALLIAAYAIVGAVLTVAVRAGVYQGGTGGTNVFLAVVVAWTAVRGAYGTIVYHRLKNTRCNIKHVVILTVIATVLSVIVLFVIVVVGLMLGYDLDRDDDRNTVDVASKVAVWTVWVLVFNRLLPFTRRLRVLKANVMAS